MNMQRRFQDVEEDFQELKRRFDGREISRGEFNEQLKKLRLRDEQGRFWMIGVRSGKWYYFNGQEWVRSDVPSLAANKVSCPHCGFGNTDGDAFCEGCGESLRGSGIACSVCGRTIEDPNSPCPHCQRESEEGTGPEPPAEVLPDRYILRRLEPLSLFLFGGCFGVVFGIIFGAFSGSTNIFSAIAALLPAFYRDLQGTLMGGIVYAVTSAVLGFAVFGILGGLAALLFNVISSFVGGIGLSWAKKSAGESVDKAGKKTV